jgi:hypothetical protein
LKKDHISHRIEHVHYPEYMTKSPNFDSAFVPEVIISGLHDVTPLEQNYILDEPIPFGLLKLYHVLGVKQQPAPR